MLARLVPAFLLLLSACASAEPPEAESQYLRLATRAESRKILTADDEFFQVLSPADLALRVAPGQPATLDALKRQYEQAVRMPDNLQRARLLRLGLWLEQTLAPIRHKLPSQILVILVSPAVEGGLPHTRANAIVLPLHIISRMSDSALQRLLLHETFHVLSRHNRASADALYAIAGFQPCRRIFIPDAIDRQRITNPDAPFNRHYLPLAAVGQNPAAGVMPYLTTANITGPGPRYYEERVALGLLTVAVNNQDCHAGPSALASFPDRSQPVYERIARNTDYVIHPEEVLADNFVFLIQNKKVEDRSLLSRLAAWLGWPQHRGARAAE